MRSPGPVLAADDDHDVWMGLALDEARAAATHDDVPIGAVVVQIDPDGTRRVVAARHNASSTGIRPRTPRCSRCGMPRRPWGAGDSTTA
jgi:hypothetical protein